MMRKPPAYRQKAGRETAIVVLTDSTTRERREYPLGPHGSPASREAYHRLVAAWEASGRRLPEVERSGAAEGVPVESLCLEYWLEVKGRKSKPELAKLRSMIRLLCQYHGSTPVDRFGPRALADLIPLMAAGDLEADPPRKAWGRHHINQQLGRVKRMFKWGVAREIVPASVHHGLTAVENVRAGTTGVRDPRKVSTVEIERVELTKPHLSPQIQALIDLQLHTGARAGELLIMRPMDLDRSGEVWIYTPATHKRAHAGEHRAIYLGPKSRRVIIPFLQRGADAFMFSPAEAEAARTGQPAKRENKPGECYTIQSYGRAIARACNRAGVARWTPHQLRHTAATRIRATHGLEAAQLILGHSSAMITDAVYAERDAAKLLGIAQAAS